MLDAHEDKAAAQAARRTRRREFVRRWKKVKEGGEVGIVITLMFFVGVWMAVEGSETGDTGMMAGGVIMMTMPFVAHALRGYRIVIDNIRVERGETKRVRQNTLEELIQELSWSDDPKDRAVLIALKNAGYGGLHHKSWVIDGMVKALLGDEYEEVIGLYNQPQFDDDGNGVWYKGWETGRAP